MRQMALLSVTMREKLKCVVETRSIVRKVKEERGQHVLEGKEDRECQN